MITSLQLRETLVNLNKRIEQSNLIKGTYHKEPHSIAVKLKVHHNTIHGWFKSDWKQMRVRDLIRLLELLEQTK